MGAVVLDASAIIAFGDRDDPQHGHARRLAAEWAGPDRAALLPASAYSECMVKPIERGMGADMDQQLADFGIQVVPIDAALARAAAWARSQRPSLRLPDALVIATALAHDAELVTLDRRMTEAFEALG